MLRRRRGRLVALSLSAVLSLTAGCVDRSAPPGSADRGPGAAVPSVPEAGVVVWSLASKPTTLDSARMRADPAATQIAAQVYDRLLGFRPGTSELAPGIATSWDADAEGRIFTFTLREGLRFHDGTSLDAMAVVWNFERWMNPEHSAHQGEFRAWRDYFGGFTGEVDAQGRAINLVARAEAVDALTVRLVLHAPFAPFLQNIAMVPFGFASPAAVALQGEDYGADGDHLPVGSGPFRVARWSADGLVAMVPFEGHWSGPPAASGLWFVPIADAGERARAVAEGRAHGAELAPTTPITGALTSPYLTVIPRPARANSWLILNLSRTPLDDVRVRRAVSLAIDRERLAREHFGSASEPSGQLLPPTFAGYEEKILAPKYDPEAAKALLAEADASTGLKLNIWVANSNRAYLPDPLGTGEAIAAMLREVGIDASVKSENLRQFLLDRDHGRFTAWLIGWEAQSGDPDNFWFWHFGAGRSAAEGQYVNADLAASLLSAQRTIGSVSDELYKEAARTVSADEARVFLVYTRPLVAVSRRVLGYEPGPLGFDFFGSVSLGPELPGQPAGGQPVAPAAEPGGTTTPSATEAITATIAVSATATITATGTAAVAAEVGGTAAATGTTTATPTAGSATAARAGGQPTAPPTAMALPLVTASVAPSPSRRSGP